MINGEIISLVDVLDERIISENMMRLAILSCLILAFFIPFIQVDTTQACSGGVPYDYWDIHQSLDSYAVVIMGRINAVSESRINAIMHVEHIFKGELSNEYIIFLGSSPLQTQSINEGRGRLARCTSIGLARNSGARFIAGLWRSNSGYYYGTVISENEEGLIVTPSFHHLETSGTFTYEELLAYTSQFIGENPRPPQDRIMPRAGIVQLFTESGNDYSLPIDTAIPIEVQPITQCHSNLQIPCLETRIAPNGIDRVSFYPVGSNLPNYLDVDTYHFAVEGETGVFSPFSDILAVWEEQEIHLYVTPNQPKFVEWRSYNSFLFGVLYTREFNPNDQLISGSGAWSPNGRTFALSSESGVWLWDILSENSHPVLLLEATDTPILVRHFSPMGNYLALTAGDRNYHVDIHSLAEYPDGVFAPDDRVLAAFDTTASTLTSLQVYAMLPEFRTFQNIGNLSTTNTQFEWINRSTYIYATCGEGTGESYQEGMLPGFEQDWCKVIRSTIGTSIAPREYIDGILFDYDPVTDSIVTLIDETTITFNGEIISLANVLDERIIGVEIIPAIDLNHRNF